MELFERGSEWRRWDLHIHTPGTNKNDQFSGLTIEEKWDKFYCDVKKYIGDGLDENKSIVAIGITDYLSIDSYKKVLNDSKLPDSVKLVLPNVEMRMTPVASSSPINIHCIFSPDIVTELDSLFFSCLKFNYDGRDYSASRNDIIKLGKAYKNNYSLDDSAAYKEGIDQFVVNSTILQKVFKASPKLRENTIIVVSNKGKDGASGARAHKDYFEGDTTSLDATIQGIYRMSDMIFSPNPNDIDYFLGKRTDSESEVKRKCGSLKPCIHGSDAHSNERIFEPDLKRYCWIKADPTFDGLKQVIFEPKQRVRISEIKPEEKLDYNVIDRIEFLDDEFQTEPIYFNSNLNCIIGGKSTGKSILLQNLAREIDEGQTKKHLDTSKRKTKDDVNLKVFWRDGKEESHKIIYIPQTYLNQLSEEKENQTEIDEWVEEILLKNDNISNSKKQLTSYINENKIYINKTLIDFLRYDEILKELDTKKLEIGNKNGIIDVIDKLSTDKEKLVSQSEISEEDIKLYDDAKGQIEDISKQKDLLDSYKEKISSIDSLIEDKTFNFTFSAEIDEAIKKSRNEIFDFATEKWEKTKVKLIEDINAQTKKLSDATIPFVETINNLKEKVESNEAVKVLTQKISDENKKLNKIKEIEESEKNVLEQRNYLMDKLSKSGSKYKSIYQTYAVVINNNTTETDGLLFQGETPFKSISFSQRLSKIYDTRKTEFKQLVGDIDDFNEEKYNDFFLKSIIEKTVDRTLTLKNGYDIEAALREILDDWYNIVYRVKMDNDFIDQMSPGKKALVLLKILISLAESKCPILIDQTVMKPMNKMVSGMENRIAKAMFKQTVEICKIFWLMVKAYNIDPDDVNDFHEDCVEEVKRINGAIRFNSRRKDDEE